MNHTEDTGAEVSAEKHRLANSALDHISKTLRLKNDAALSRALQVAPPVISKIRNGRISFGPSMVIRAHEITGLPVRSIKDLLGETSLSPYTTA